MQMFNQFCTRELAARVGELAMARIKEPLRKSGSIDQYLLENVLTLFQIFLANNVLKNQKPDARTKLNFTWFTEDVYLLYTDTEKGTAKVVQLRFHLPFLFRSVFSVYIILYSVCI